MAFLWLHLLTWKWRSNWLWSGLILVTSQIWSIPLNLVKKLGQAERPNITDHRTARVTHNRTTLLTGLYIFSLLLPFFSREPTFSPRFRRFFWDSCCTWMSPCAAATWLALQCNTAAFDGCFYSPPIPFQNFQVIVKNEKTKWSNWKLFFKCLKNN